MNSTMNRINPEIYTLDSVNVAPLLLGKLLCVNTNGTVKKARITETEAYFGEDDTACHAHKGRTKRTEILYRKGGVSYVYLCYGIHALMNVITGPDEHPQGVLLRGVEGLSGPGKLTKAMGITCEHNGVDLVSSDIIWLEDDGFKPKEIKTSPRIGIDYATKEYRDKLWRFYI